MASCEKCWSDAYYLQDCEEGHVEKYAKLIEERKDNPCTPEEQAGNDAGFCPVCERNTVHQHAKSCTECTYKELKQRLEK